MGNPVEALLGIQQHSYLRFDISPQHAFSDRRLLNNPLLFIPTHFWPLVHDNLLPQSYHTLIVELPILGLLL